MHVIKCIQKSSKEHLTQARWQEHIKNVTDRKCIALNPFYYAYDYYFRYSIKENNSPFCIRFHVSVNKKCHPQVEGQKCDPRAFFECKGSEKPFDIDSDGYYACILRKI